MPDNCHSLKEFASGISKRHAYQGKSYGGWEAGVFGNACAIKCADHPMYVCRKPGRRGLRCVCWSTNCARV